MTKLFISLIIIFILSSCKNDKPIIYENFQALKCGTFKDKNDKIYIFDRDNGYLYFYDELNDRFLPISQRYEANYFSERTPEIISTINRNQLKIIGLKYNVNSNEQYSRIEHTINLKSLIKKSTFKNKDNKFISLKLKCNWIDPKLGIK